jgi:hypothetical protein
VLGIFTLGFRHGFDPDHVAALTDIAGSEPFRARAFVLSTMYAVGHALMVLTLGLALAIGDFELPDTGRLVGATLLLMGGYVLWQVGRGRPAESRARLLHRGLRAVRHRLRPTVAVEHEHPHDHTGRHGHAHALAEHGAADAPTAAVTVTHSHRHRHEGLSGSYGPMAVVGVGLVHGLGVETPTQVLALASGASALPPFLIGLFLGNTVVAATATGTLTVRRLRALNVFVALFSLLIGSAYLLGTEPFLSW